MRIFEELKDEENKKLYRKLSRKYHPDLKGGDENVMKKMNNAVDKGDAAFKAFYNELTGKTPPAPKKKKYDTGVHKHEGYNWIDKFTEMLHDEIKSMEEVNAIRTIARAPGPERPFFIDLKDGRHIQVSYLESPASPSIAVWMISKKGMPMEWKMEGDKWRENLVARSIEMARNGIKNIIKAKDFREADDEDPWENAERETYRDSRRGK